MGSEGEEMWFVCSWQSGRFWPQVAQVQIELWAIFIMNVHLINVNLHVKDENEEKEGDNGSLKRWSK